MHPTPLTTNHYSSNATLLDLQRDNPFIRDTAAAVAGVLSWVINVGANFAHVSPTFRFETYTDTDQYCDILELARTIAISYIVQSIKQSYKVVFSSKFEMNINFAS